MHRQNQELKWAFNTILLFSLIYLFVVTYTGSVPAASELFGHSLGISGFLLMLMTETLYSIRKRSRKAGWGKMSSWLKFHIFTGLVGPYLVLLHSSWKFNGLAGVVMLFTGFIVLSGFVGRYIYISVPRTADGIILESHVLEQQIAATESSLQKWLETQSEATQRFARRMQSVPDFSETSSRVVLGRFIQEWGYRFEWWMEKRRIRSITREQASFLENLMRRRRVLRRQLASFAVARNLLGLWHAIHVPIGMVLFISAFIHLGGAIYYATLLR